jgi:hypothetical protein
MTENSKKQENKQLNRESTTIHLPLHQSTENNLIAIVFNGSIVSHLRSYKELSTKLY